MPRTINDSDSSFAVGSFTGRIASLLDEDKETLQERAARFENQGEIQYPFEETTGTGDENKIRGNWSSKSDFFALCLGFTVGFGNFWRFPFYFHLHGGTTFLLPYLLSLMFIGIPLFFLELTLGQFSSVGCITVWKVCPLFKGIGIAMFLVSCCFAIYRNVIISWSVYYLINSLRSDVPWKTCTNSWNTMNCTIVSRQLVRSCVALNGSLHNNGSCIRATKENGSVLLGSDLSSPKISAHFAPHPVWPSSEYFHNQVLELSDDITQVGKIQWQLALYSFLAWIFIFFSLFKGVKSAGKVAYVTTIVPFVISSVFLVRALFYDGSLRGMLEFIQPDWTSLLDFRIWGDAALQAFYSLCCCWGALITLASYNRFHTNIYKQSFILCFSNVLSSIFFGVVVFATVGLMAYETKAPSVASLAQKDFDIAFVLFAETIARASVAPVWAVLFFAMVILLGIDSQIVAVETIVTAVCDEFPETLRRYHRHVLALCTVLFYALGVPFCTQVGLYLIVLLENYFATWPLLIIAFFECMVIVWVYGVDNLLDNVKWMIGYFPSPYIVWKVIWLFITPACIMVLLTYTWVFYAPTSYAQYRFPDWAETVGWAISMLPVLLIPLTAFVQFLITSGSCTERFRVLLSPESDWGPALAVYRSQEYPLQIPEAKDPVRLPWVSKKDAKQGRALEAGGQVEKDQEKGALLYERETAI